MGEQPARGDGRHDAQLTNRKRIHPFGIHSLGNGRRWLAALAFCVALGGAALPAQADLAALAAARDALQQELRDLRRVLPVQAGDRAAIARFEVRLAQLEEELRALTGRIEQAEHGRRQLEGRFDQLVADLDQRLQTLEQAAAAPDTGSEDTGEPAPQAALAPSDPDAWTPPGEAPAAEDGDDQVLGTVPQSALEGIARPQTNGAAAQSEQAALTPQQQYDNAIDMLRVGDYQGAQQGLDQFLERNDSHPLAANAAYWLAETYYVRQNYAAAAAAFARNYRTYGKDASKAVDNLLKLGMSLNGLGETAKACLSYEELSRAFPEAPPHIQQALARERARAQCA